MFRDSGRQAGGDLMIESGDIGGGSAGLCSKIITGEVVSVRPELKPKAERTKRRTRRRRSAGNRRNQR